MGGLPKLLCLLCMVHHVKIIYVLSRNETASAVSLCLMATEMRRNSRNPHGCCFVMRRKENSLTELRLLCNPDRPGERILNNTTL